MAAWKDIGMFLAKEQIVSAQFDDIKRRFMEVAVGDEADACTWDFIFANDELATKFTDSQIDFGALDAIVGGDMDLAALETAANKKSA